MKIPVSVIIITKNEERNIGRCLAALRDFSEVVVVDSNSDDLTQNVAAARGARVVNFIWDGRYPKKRQWCLDTLSLAHEWVFFVDADEVVTPALAQEIAALDFSCAGYFVQGRYVLDGVALNFGLKNKKLALFDRRKICFPVIDDLDLSGMGEIEGHYQPVLKATATGKIGGLRAPLLHYAYHSREAWQGRHARYADWERGMNAKSAWPEDPVFVRRVVKKIFRALPFRGVIAFLHSYVLKCGFLDGKRGWEFAMDRYAYYSLIAR
jgi:glycosyltransferase involved in cell wall biosynthesis